MLMFSNSGWGILGSLMMQGNLDVHGASETAGVDLLETNFLFFAISMVIICLH